MAISELGYAIDTKPVVDAAREMEKLTSAEVNAAKGADDLGKGVRKTTAAIDTATKSTKTHNTIIGGSGAVYREVQERIDRARRATDENKKSVDNLGAGVDKLTVSNTRATTVTDRLSGSFVNMAKSAGAALVATFAFSRTVSTLAGFERSMSQVAAITRATGDELGALRDTAKQLGATTEFSASQAADGLKFLGMAGFSAAESMAAIPAVLDLATASGMGLASAADITSNIMSGFGIEASKAGKVADVLAAASSRANTDVNQLGTAMAYAAPVAASLGISIEETAAAIGVLSDAGLQGSQAGTGLRAVLASLVKPSKEGQKALASLGLTLSDVNPNLHSTTDIMRRLNKAGLDAQTAIRLFGREASSAGLALAGSYEHLGDLTRGIEDAEGEAARMAATMRDNLKGSLDGLTSALESVIIEMGEAGLTDVIRGAVDVTAALVRGIGSVISGFNKLTGIGSAIGSAFKLLTDNMDRFVAYAGAAATVVALRLAPAILGLTVGVGRLTAAFILSRAALIATGYGALIVVIGELANRFSKLTAEVGGLGVILGAASRASEAFFENIQRGTGAMSSAFSAAGNYIMSKFAYVYAQLQKGFANFISYVERGINGMINKINNIGSALPEWLGGREGGFGIELVDFASSYMDAAADSFNDAKKYADQATESYRRMQDIREEGLLSPSHIFKDELEKGKELKSLVESIKDIPLSQAASQVIPDLGDGGGATDISGGKGAGKRAKQAIDEYINDLKSLQEALRSPLESLNVWFDEQSVILADQRAIEIMGIQAHNEAKLALNEEYQRRLAEINGYYSSDSLVQAKTFMGDMADNLQSGNEKMLRISQVFSAAQALINSYVAYTEVLKDPLLPWWGRIPAAVGVLSAGMGMVKAIKGVSKGGSGGGGAAQSSVSAPPQRTVNISVQGDYFTADTIRGIVEGLNEFTSDGGNVNVSRV